MAFPIDMLGACELFIAFITVYTNNISVVAFPAGTMGYTPSSLATTKSMITMLSVARASLITGSTSLGFVALGPLAQKALAS